MAAGDLEARSPPSGYEDESSTIGHSKLSCVSCRRRKIRCDREWPQCTVCSRLKQLCTYLPGPLKPGPKIGTSQRKRKRAYNKSNAKILLPERDLGRENLLSESEEGPHGGNLPRHAFGSNTRQHGQLYTNDAEANTFSRKLHTQEYSPLTPESNTSYRTPKADVIRLQDLAHLIHPSHETGTQSEVGDNHRPFEDGPRTRTDGEMGTFVDACNALNISTEKAHRLINLYFEHMTAFSLFHRPTFCDELRKIKCYLLLCATLSAMFSYSARFYTEDDHYTPQYFGSGRKSQHTPEMFLDLALGFVERSLKEFSDEPPPLCLLQALVLITFQQLIKGVRGNAWRSLGICVRLAYELSLHLVDSKNDPAVEVDVVQWCADEERRRAWWAIWELDVFASTVKRCPTAIDWSENQTNLPVEDELWFKHAYQRSCSLAIRPIDRWKMLQQSGNDSSKAWYIIVNSLMRDAQSRSNQSQQTIAEYNNSERLAVVSHALRCYTLTLPKRLQYHGEYLSFTARDPATAIATRQLHSTKYIIHHMIQLTKFMIYHQRAFAGILYDKFEKETSSQTADSSRLGPLREKSTQTREQPDNNALNLFLRAADSILDIISNSADDQVRHVNPLLASTVWLAAAVQVVYKVFGSPAMNRDFADSKFDVLQLQHRLYVDFWKTPKILQQSLQLLEEQLEQMRAPNVHSITPGDIGSKKASKSAPTEFDHEIASACAGRVLVDHPNMVMPTRYNYDIHSPSMSIPSTAAFQSETDLQAANTLSSIQHMMAIPSTENSGSAGLPTLPNTNDGFGYPNQELEWDFGINDTVPFYLDELLSGSFMTSST